MWKSYKKEYLEECNKNEKSNKTNNNLNIRLNENR